MSLRNAVPAVALLFLAGAGGYAVGRDRPPGAGSAEVGFLHDMIVHHEQAVAMAFETVDEAADPEVHSFAKEILMAQQYELGLMEAYLARWGHLRDSGRPTAMEWMGEAHPKDAMPGMASAEAVAALAAATGPALDDRFLHLMIVHHEAGVAMAEAALERVDDGALRRLAERIVQAQESEIVEMGATRRRLGLPGAPAGGDHT
ncbi:MAG TPA: DUF305 domain-containing protein, partial [Acidimicrobiia bacterium]|nr:DUF305 domain-containing protein [Acidimicrobiia bacterium]